MSNFDTHLQAILARCVSHHGLCAPITLEVTDSEGRMQSARYYEDCDPEMVEGEGPMKMDPPLSVFAHDEQGGSAGFTVDLLGVRPRSIH